MAQHFPALPIRCTHDACKHIEPVETLAGFNGDLPEYVCSPLPCATGPAESQAHTATHRPKHG